LAERYEERSSVSATSAPAGDAPIFLDAALPARATEARTPKEHKAEPSVPEFSIEKPSVEDSASEEEAAPKEAAPVAKAASPWPKTADQADEIAVEADAPEFAVADESSAEDSAAAVSSEIDLSAEWDDALTVETDAPATEAPEVEATSHAGVLQSSKADETVDEIRFYISHGMPAQAMAGLAKLQTLTSDQALLDELHAEIEAATQPAEEEISAVAEPVVEELGAEDIPTLEVEVEEAPVDVAPATVEAPAAAVPEPPVVKEIPVVAEAAVEIEAEPVVHEPSVLKEFVSDLETSLGDGFLPETGAKPAATPAARIPATPKPVPVAPAEPVVASAPVLGEFVADIEASLGEDFLKAAPVAQPESPAPVKTAPPKLIPPAPAPVVVPPIVAPPVVAPQVVPPMAASAAASASAANQVAPSAPQSAPTMAAPATAATASVAWQAPAVNVAKPQPPISRGPAAHTPPSAAVKASPFGDDAGVDLAEMFGELKQDLEADVASADEDPETHYNLGIAFREMGLLDEAIGELQKACQSFDRGKPFPQIMQTYTWLAQCFLEKGVPEAAVRWYDKALKVPGIDGETRVALHYELAAAYETAGDKPSALHHFMDVYGSNIDYRDVAERIKALKS
jgi:hypothetical protein